MLEEPLERGRQKKNHKPVVDSVERRMVPLISGGDSIDSSDEEGSDDPTELQPLRRR